MHYIKRTISFLNPWKMCRYNCNWNFTTSLEYLFAQRQEKMWTNVPWWNALFFHHIICFFLQCLLFLSWAFNIAQGEKKTLSFRTSCTPHWMVLLLHDKVLAYLSMFSSGCMPFDFRLGVNKCWGTVSMAEHLHKGYYVLLAQQSSNKLILNNNLQAAQHMVNVHHSCSGLNILLAFFHSGDPVIRLMGQ